MEEGARRLLAVGALAAALAAFAARGCASRPGPGASAAPLALSTRIGSFTLHPGPDTRLAVHATSGAEREMALALVVDGVRHSFAPDRSRVRVEEGALTATSRVEVGGGALSVSATLRVDPRSQALVASATELGGPDAGTHGLAVRVELPTEGRSAFVSGVGEVADLGSVAGQIVTLPAELMVLGFAARHGALQITSEAGDERDPGSPMRLAVQSGAPAEAEASGPPEIRIVAAADEEQAWADLFRSVGEAVARVRGVVTGARTRCRVHGLDAQGAPRISLDAAADGRFAAQVPKSVVKWYAAIDPSQTSPPTYYVPGTPWELKLDVSPGGELEVHIRDPDTKDPVTARLLVHGIDGTLDPTFGPDYRASGAGPLIDALRGDAVTPLPAGRYRVAATKGIEWSIDATNIEVEPGKRAVVNLLPRHVVPTPGAVSADLHVHARPSFDAPVSPEDRVLSLVAAGIEFAVPTEHNIVGDYTSMLAALDLSHDLAFVPGVEVTTYSPRFGHFGVFPYKGQVPPFRGTNPGALFGAARRGDPTRIVQVNHPRLPAAIGYFNVFHYEPQTGKPPPPSMRMDFDTIEVFNGYDLAKGDRVDAVMRDWFALLNQGYRPVATGDSDSHRIQYQWAGYPRNLIAAGEAASGDKGPLDPAAIVQALKKGHSIVTNGPVIELEAAGGRPGDEITTADDPVHLHVRVRAAPWVDVTQIEVVAGGRTLATAPVTSRPSKLGPESGTLEEAWARTVRYDEDLPVSVGSANTWIVVIARGTRKLDDVLPFMPTVPLAFTNPVWITRDPRAVVRKPARTAQPGRAH